MTRRNVAVALTVASVALGLGACRSTPETAATPGAGTTSTTKTTFTTDSVKSTRTGSTGEPMSTQEAMAASRRADSVTAANLAAARAAEGRAAADARAAAARADADARTASTRAAVTNELMQTLSQTVYFDYDKDQLRDDARTSLDAKAPILVENSSVTVTITGHTDERGTPEYNLLLGQRRAAQVKRYLESKGVAGSRMATQSLGESQPAVQGNDEAAYHLNRRAEFEIGNASGGLVRPRS